MHRQSVSATVVDSAVGRRSSSGPDIAQYMEIFRQDLSDAKDEIEEQLESKYAKQVAFLNGEIDGSD